MLADVYKPSVARVMSREDDERVSAVVSDSYDVLIVGARVAGSSLALLLGQLGHRVLMVDRDHFPSDTLSTHYMGPQAVPLLAKLGVLQDVEKAGFRRITRARTYVGDCSFEGPIAPGDGFALAPRRDALDSILIKHACERGGVTFRERTNAVGLIEEDGRVVGAHVKGNEGAPQEVRARVVVGADGKNSQVAQWVNAERYYAVPPLRPVYYGYYHGVAPLPDAAFEFFFVNDTMGLIFPMQPNVDCLALELQPEEFDLMRTDPKGAFEARFRALPGMAARLTHATLEGKIKGSRGIPNHFCQPYGDAWVLTGDAGYLKDPSTGFGIGDALNQSFWLAEALQEALGGADWKACLERFKLKRDETFLPFYNITLGFTQQRDSPPEDLAWIQAVLSSPGLARSLALGLPTMLLSVFPEGARPRVTAMAQAFGARPTAEA
jgi:flavin-dependent dehydrogenase